MTRDHIDKGNAKVPIGPSGTISALLADVDGTLVTKAKVLTKRAIEAVRRLHESGIAFFITSGRPPRGMRMLIEPLGLKVPMAAFNGGMIVHPDLSVVDERPLSDDVVPDVINTLLAHGLDVWIYRGTDWYVLIYIHKETALDDVQSRYPAERYVLVDDKLRILAAVKKAWGDRVTTVFPQQGKFANDPNTLAAYPDVADVTVDRIGDQLDYELADLLRNKSKKAKKGLTGMKATQLLENLGQSLWLDNITRDLLDSGTLQHYIDELSVTGLTSNPTIFDHAIKNSLAYDASIRDALSKGKAGEELFFDLALNDITRAADLFRAIYDRTNTVDGWVSLEVSPLLAHDTATTLAEAKQLFALAARPNLLIKIPGTKEGLPAIEEAIFSGISVNVTLLFSRAHYVAAAEAFLRGIERRMEAGLNPNVGSVASVFVSRWDAAVADKVPAALRNQLGLAVAKQTYKAYRALLSSPRWQRIYNAGARPQRLLWASTGTKDPSASDILYVKGLAAPFTVNTMPEKTLKALAAHNELGSILPLGGGDCEEVLAEFAKAGVDVDALGAQLQDEGAKSFVKSWNDLMQVIASKSDLLKRVA